MRRLMTIVATLGCALTLAACFGQNDQKTDETAATSEQPARPPQRTTEQPRPAATTTAAPTPVQIAQCVQAGLAADNRTETQARTLQVGAWVTINGTRQRVATGQSYWSLCSGPSLDEQLATMTRYRNEWRTYARELEPLALVNPGLGIRAEDNTWYGRHERLSTDNQTLSTQLAKSQSQARVMTVLFIVALIGLIILGIALWLSLDKRKRSGDLAGVDPRSGTRPVTAGTGHTE